MKNDIFSQLFPKAGEVAALKQANASLEAELAEAKKEIQALKAETAPRQETFDTAVNRQVVATLAAKGFPAGTVKEENSATLTPQQAFERFNTLKGDERTAFYNQHRSLILQAA